MGIAERVRDGLARWETFLRLDRLTSSGEMVRARLIYFVCAFFILMQLINQVELYRVHGGFNSQIVVSALVCVGLAGAALLLRRTVDGRVFGGLFAGMMLVGVASATLTTPHAPMIAGINSALLPLLVAGGALIGWMGSRLVSVVYAGLASALLVWMFTYSGHLVAGAGYGAAVTEALTVNHSRRLAQALIATVATTVVSASFGHRFYDLVDGFESSAEAARRLERIKSDFHANMSHEIRSPLSGIIGMSDVLSNMELGERQAECARIINEAGRNLHRIIDEVLDVSKLDEGMLTLDTAPFALDRMLDGMVALHKASLTAGMTGDDIWLGVDWQRGMPGRVVGDEARLRQVVGNLVGNALKFTKSGGVRVGVRGAVLPTGTHARYQIFVQDTGPGISAEDQATIFERYGQSAEGRRLGSAGTGLGLSIASDIVGLMGGKLAVSSEPGRGATFHFTVELELATEGRAALSDAA